MTSLASRKTEAEYRQQKRRVALITGVTGQDGSYLTEMLLSHEEFEYTVHGIVRSSSSHNTERIDQNQDRLVLHVADLSSSSNLVNILEKVNIKPHNCT
jgi:GDPmannose 4,6-dehydratase